MNEETQNKMAEMERKIDEIYESVEKTRKYFLWTMIITAAVLILPLIGLMFIVPSFLSSYTSALETLSI